MPSASPPPLTSTVSTVFDRFLKKLEDDTILNKRALEAMKQSLHAQKLDPESLRKALFTPKEKPK